MRKALALLAIAGGSLLDLLRRRGGTRERVSFDYADGSMVTLDRKTLGVEKVLTLARDAFELATSSASGSASTRCSRATSSFAPGDARSFYLDKYRFETQPELLAPIGERLAAAARQFEPDAVRLAGPALGAVALAAAASLSSGLPFLIVRPEAKGYGTANRVEGPFEPGELVCLVEDVVTSGGALAEAVKAVREAGLEVRNAVCVVDREEGGADALARLGVRLRRALHGRRTPAAGKSCRKPAWLSQSDAAVRVLGGSRPLPDTGGVARDEAGVC